MEAARHQRSKVHGELYVLYEPILHRTALAFASMFHMGIIKRITLTRVS